MKIIQHLKNNTYKSSLNDYVDKNIDGKICNVYHDGTKWEVSPKLNRDIFIKAVGGDPDKIFFEISRNLVIIFLLEFYELSHTAFLLDVMDSDSGTLYGQKISWFWVTPKGTTWRYPKEYVNKGEGNDLYIRC